MPKTSTKVSAGKAKCSFYFYCASVYLAGLFRRFASAIDPSPRQINNN